MLKMVPSEQLTTTQDSPHMSIASRINATKAMLYWSTINYDFSSKRENLQLVASEMGICYGTQTIPWELFKSSLSPKKQQRLICLIFDTWYVMFFISDKYRCQHQVKLPFKMMMAWEKALVTDWWPDHPKALDGRTDGIAWTSEVE